MTTSLCTSFGCAILGFSGAVKTKTPLLLAGFSYKELGDDLLSHTKSTLSLAQVRFTALFEMGRGGSKPLLSPNITGNVMHGAERMFSLL
jgi:hypothetical protein